MTWREEFIKDMYEAQGYTVLKDGYPDLFVFNDDGFMFIEVKSETDKVRKSQNKMFKAMKKFGMKVHIDIVEDAIVKGGGTDSAK